MMGKAIIKFTFLQSADLGARIRSRLTCSSFAHPDSASARSSSSLSSLSVSSTPWTPLKAKPQSTGRPTNTILAPRASALRTSVPVRIPPAADIKLSVNPTHFVIILVIKSTMMTYTVQVQFTSASDLLPDGLQDIDGGWDAVNLPGTVIGHHDPLHTIGQGNLRVIRAQNSFQDHGQLGEGLEPGHVLPAQCLVEERGDILADAGAVLVLPSLGLQVAHARKVGHAEVAGKRELVAGVGEALAEERRVHRQNQRGEPGRLRATNQSLGYLCKLGTIE